ncbi:glyceraldehyde 3-phosphate dehydrogenase NAD-binding domain-containing protein [Streptomyces sp. HUAS TT20]|uniref:glyceraldehyde 3-phosphate dehydrogenase NAD-binding domain-containing protein n=1 Tax=Streptomyces sp. HUAS TT20 TaxID=3447509 RepID=UPI0021DB5D27|nr:glyceraldehyde 3-phosphate dehydrogenase NAD-binding domain-containing protein [Streptomyces sp. HUAS 15-9]UXY25317.1 hypothetical protein N8I87_01185 [Streptomyces sp. HUAS 15-9]
MPKVAVNGLGRIGRAALKILHEVEGVEVAAVNDLIEADNLACLLAHDSVYGRYGKPVTVSFVILYAPARTETVATVVHRVNRAPRGRQVISSASCTTNCITPVVEVLDRRIGIERAVMSTVHAYTAGQRLVDGPGKDVRRGRCAGVNMVPATTGAALTTTRASPTGRAFGRRGDPGTRAGRFDRRHHAGHRPAHQYPGGQRPLSQGGHERPLPRRRRGAVGLHGHHRRPQGLGSESRRVQPLRHGPGQLPGESRVSIDNLIVKACATALT